MELSEAILMALLGLIITALIWMWRDGLSRTRDNEKKLIALETKVQVVEQQYYHNSLTEERLEKILEQHFKQFELLLVNEGRILPRYQRRKNVKGESNKDS